MLAHTGIRWGELAGLQVGDRISVPAPGLRLQRAVLTSSGSGELFVDSLKNYRSRTIPLTPRAAEIIGRWAGGREPHEWLFASPTGTALRESNWKRMIGWTPAKAAIGRPTIRVHDLRHTAASVWLGQGADPKVVQRILGHASATMTMDLYGHLMDANLWEAARRFVDISWTPRHDDEEASDGWKKKEGPETGPSSRVDLRRSLSNVTPSLRTPISDTLAGTEDVRGPVKSSAAVKRLRRLDASEQAGLVEHYRSGETVYQLADRYGIHRHTVSKHLRSGGVRLRLDGLTTEQEVDAVQLYESGLSIARVAERFGVAPRTILSCLRKHRVVMRDSHGRER